MPQNNNIFITTFMKIWLLVFLSAILVKPHYSCSFHIILRMYEGDSIYNEIAPNTPPTHGLELYTIYGMKDQGFTFRMVHKTLFYHSYLSSYRL